MPTVHGFDDLVHGSEAYVSRHEELASAEPRRGLAVLTCIDSRIDPLAMFGLALGDAKVLRNAGARVTDDVIRSLAVAVAALGVERIAVVQHTGCRMASVSEEEAATAVAEATGRQVAGVDFGTIADQEAVLRADVDALRTSPLIPDSVAVGGFVLDLATGRLTPTP